MGPAVLINRYQRNDDRTHRSQASVSVGRSLTEEERPGACPPVSRPAYRDRVADWTGEGRSTAELYLGMAVHELHGVSPSYEALCRAVAGSELICALLDRLPPAKRQPNLLLGAVRFLGGPVDDPASFLNFVTARWGAVEDTMMAHRTQTNEPGRCATLLPLLASLPQPLALVEVGASAGLCLYPDRYSYRYTTSLGEHRLGDSQIAMACAVTGPAPLPERLPEVVWRAGHGAGHRDLAVTEPMLAQARCVAVAVPVGIQAQAGAGSDFDQSQRLG